MNHNEALEYLKTHPVFWSRLGFCYDPPLKTESGKPVVFCEDLSIAGDTHRSFGKIGVKIHTCILHSGWVGVDEYDYSLTDRVLDEVFRDNPDCYFIPRVKLNVPIDWCYENPEDVFVYYEGPRTVDGIRELVGTLRHDYIGYESKNGYYLAGAVDYIDKRPNLNTLIARQSFSSAKWLNDAGIAFEKLIDRLENSKYADRIIGYHIAFGASGECVLWGRSSNRYGDYGIGHTREFYKWGLRKYGSRDALAKAWCQADIDIDNISLPSPSERYANTQTIDGFFRGGAENNISTDFDLFISDVNATAIEYFAKLLKSKSPEKLAGIFYGYFVHVDNPAYTGHLAIDRLLDSPYIDFFAAPKSYYRNQAGDPGGVLSATQSINRKKLWLDELDNRTHLAKGVDPEWTSFDFGTTQTVFWREFAKNLADGSGFWWMDLGGGWFDSDEIMDEFAKLVKAHVEVQKTAHVDSNDVLVVIDNDCINHMNISSKLRRGFMEDFLCELHMTGVGVDMFRVADLPTLKLEQYKLIIFAYTFELNDELRKLIDGIPPTTTLMFNHAAGVIDGESVSLENTRRLTGVRLEEFEGEKYDFPALRIAGSSEVEPIVSDDGGNLRVAMHKRANGGINVVNTKPFMTRNELRKIADIAGCHAFTDAGCTVYTDNRFVGVFPKDDFDGCVKMKERATYVELLSGKRFEATDSIPLYIKAAGAAFLLKV